MLPEIQSRERLLICCTDPSACGIVAHSRRLIGLLLNTPMNARMESYSAVNCFSSYLLPHILFVPQFEVRERAAMACFLAWNLSLFPFADREEQLERIRKNLEFKRAPMAEANSASKFKSHIRSLVQQKVEYFPCVEADISGAELIPAQGHDILRIAADSSPEDIRIATSPSPLGLEVLRGTLSKMQTETAAQVELLLDRVVKNPQAITKADARLMTTVYGVQRADLISYQRILQAWYDSQPVPHVRHLIAESQAAAAEITTGTKVVLDILERCR